MSKTNEKNFKELYLFRKIDYTVIRKRDTMDINEIKRILEKNKNEILELWGSL